MPLAPNGKSNLNNGPLNFTPAASGVKPPESLPPDPAPKLDPSPTPEEPNKELEEIDARVKKMREIVNAAEKEMQDEGEIDGSLGFFRGKSYIQDMAEKKSRDAYHRAVCIMEASHREVEVQLNDERRHYAEAMKTLESTQHYKEYLEHNRRYAAYSFSRAVIWIGLLVGILLMLADIPLAVELIKTGFTLKGIEPDLAQAGYDPDKLQALIEKSDIRYLFHDFWPVFQANWEVFVTAIGISLCTILIKLYYDEEIGTAYGAWILQKKKHLELFTPYGSKSFSPPGKQLPEAQPAEKNTEKKEKVGGFFEGDDFNQIKRDTRKKAGFKYALLILTLITIFFIGLFRVKSMKLRDADQHFDIRSKEIVADVSMSALQADSALTSERMILNDVKDNTGGFVFPATFILITLLFPLISGVCLSQGITAWQNRRKLKSTNKQLKTDLGAVTQCNMTLKVVEGQYNSWQLERKEFEQKSQWLSNFVNVLGILYNKGYVLGMAGALEKRKISGQMAIMYDWMRKTLYHNILQTGFKKIDYDKTRTERPDAGKPSGPDSMDDGTDDDNVTSPVVV